MVKGFFWSLASFYADLLNGGGYICPLRNGYGGQLFFTELITLIVKRWRHFQWWMQNGKFISNDSRAVTSRIFLTLGRLKLSWFLCALFYIKIRRTKSNRKITGFKVVAFWCFSILRTHASYNPEYLQFRDSNFILSKYWHFFTICQVWNWNR